MYLGIHSDSHIHHCPNAIVWLNSATKILNTMEATANDNGDSNVRVAVRCRPFSSTEKANGEVSCVTIFKDRIVLANPNNASDEQSFAFDLIFDQSSFQASVWNAIGLPILSKAFDGYNGTIFAYGQTGSGMWSTPAVLKEHHLITLMNYLPYPCNQGRLGQCKVVPVMEIYKASFHV